MVKPNEISADSIYWNVAGSTACWTALYLALVRSKYGNHSHEFFCRIVTIIHAVVAVSLSAGCYWQGPDPYSNPGEKNTALQDTTLAITLGYFLFDLSWCLYHQTESFIMLVHHFASVLAIGIILLGRTSGAEAVHGILTLEVTNPLLQLRWFLRSAGYNKSFIHTSVEILFIVSFVVMRLGFGTALTYSVVSSSAVKRDVKMCTLSLYVVSLAFIFYILQFLKKKYGKKSASD